MTNKAEDGEEKIEIKKNITLFGACSFVICLVIGSGIFISPKGILRGSGSIGLSLIIWFICGIRALIRSFIFAEIGTVVPDFGGCYIYYLEAFAPNRRHKKIWWRSLPSFLFVWENTILSQASDTAIASLIAAEYFTRLAVFDCSNWSSYVSPTSAVKCLAAVILMFTAATNSYSAPLSVKIGKLLVGLKFIGLGLILAGGIYRISIGKTEELYSGFEGTKLDFRELALAFYVGNFAFDGGISLTFVTKEIKNPTRNLPIALISSMIFVIFIYMSINISYYSALSKDELLASETVAVMFGYEIAGQWGQTLMILLVASSVVGSLNSDFYFASRVSFKAGQEGHLPDVLSFIHLRNFTPSFAIWFNCLATSIMINMSDIFGLIIVSTFTRRIFDILAIVSLFIFRKSKPNAPRPIKVPILLPIFEILYNVTLLILPFLGELRIEYLYGIAYHAVGCIIYTIFVHHKVSIKGYEGFSRLIQKLLLVAPEDEWQNLREA